MIYGVKAFITFRYAHHAMLVAPPNKGKVMKKIIGGLVLIGCTLFLLSNHANAQAIYGPQGQYKGYVQVSPSGVASVYDNYGKLLELFQQDNGQTNFYGATGNYRGTVTAPIYIMPNSTIDTPRNVPQVPSVGGW